MLDGEEQARDWNLDCPEHGVGTDYWNAPENVARREAQNARLRELYRLRNEARKQHGL